MLVIITWLDHVGDAGWTEAKDIEAEECTTVGYLMEETDREYKVANTITKTGHGGVTLILKGTVIDFVEIEFK